MYTNVILPLPSFVVDAGVMTAAAANKIVLIRQKCMSTRFNLPLILCRLSFGMHYFCRAPAATLFQKAYDDE